MSQLPPRERFLNAFRSAIADQALTKLTLGKYRGDDDSLKNVFVRPITLRDKPHFAFVWRHATRDITKNFPPDEAVNQVARLLGSQFLDAHLFTPAQTAQFETAPNGRHRVRFKVADSAPPFAAQDHDRKKQHLIDAHAGWLRDLGVTTPDGKPRAGLAPKFRQIQKFAEILRHAIDETGHENEEDDAVLRISDMGSGKGYLTFAAAALLGPKAKIRGIERRQELVDTCNQIAQKYSLINLSFVAGDIDALPRKDIDVLIALHACDTATDDALAAGVDAQARLIIVAPCCQKELRPQLRPSPVLAPALLHGIFRERQAEFATDALRALLLESRGYVTKVFEFISTEHTAKNLMITATLPAERLGEKQLATATQRARAFAHFYGIQSQALAAHLGISLTD